MATAQTWRVSSFNGLVEELLGRHVSFIEKDVLKISHWDKGEDARLREDARFRKTPWGRWILASHLLANEVLYCKFQDGLHATMPLKVLLAGVADEVDDHVVFCSGDKRFILSGDDIRLAATELSGEPLPEDISDMEKFATHLPLHSLSAVAASEPAGEWGPSSQEELIETLGWIRVDLGQRLNDRMFVAQIQGNSMDDGRSGLEDGTLAVFELWPVGTRQNLTVLVRGAFNDPETGGYAVKKYVADTRDEEGMHHRITLVSLNPDKEIYPDIHLDPENDDDVIAIARLVRALAPEQIGRKPKPRQSRGRRDLTSDSGRKRIAKGMQSSLQKLFEDKETQDDSAGQESSKDWSAQYVCLDADAGGLHIETQKLTGFPAFAKKLVVTSGKHSVTVLSSNLRSRVWRIAVPPSLDAYSWSAPGHEDMLDDDLELLRLESPYPDQATIFRLDASGVGQVGASRSLTPGQIYRLLLPPALADVEVREDECSKLNDGWRLWELSVPTVPSKALLARLAEVECKLGKSAPQVSWVVVPPSSYYLTDKGASIPSFMTVQPPVLAVCGIAAENSDELMAFLTDGEKLTSLPLPEGDEWFVQIPNLGPGRYLIEVVHARTQFERIKVPFIIENEPLEGVQAQLEVTLGDESITPDEDGQILFEGVDISNLGGEQQPFSISVPSLWKARYGWGTEVRLHLWKTYADTSGTVDTETIAERTSEYRRNATIGDLSIDFGELGLVTIQHERQVDPEVMRTQIAAKVEEQAANIEQLLGQFDLLRTVWLDQLLRDLGFSLGAVADTDLLGAPIGSTSLLLYETQRSAGRINKSLNRVLILTAPQVDSQATGDGTARSYAEQLCKTYSVSEAVITDGLRWRKHRKGRVAMPMTLDIRKVVQSSDDFNNFLFAYGLV